MCECVCTEVRAMCINVQKSARTLPMNWFHLLSGTSPFPGTKVVQHRRLLTWGRNLWRKRQFAVRLLRDGRVNKKRARKPARDATFQGMRDWFNQHGMQFNFNRQKILLVLMFFSNARALFLKRLAGPPSYLEYAVGYPSLWSAVLSPLPASHQAACCQTNRPAHCHSLRILNKVTQLATMHLATWLFVSYRHRKGLC